MNRLIPFSIVLFESGRIPPLLKELPVVKFGYLCEQTSRALEDHMEYNNDECYPWKCISGYQLQQVYLSSHVNPRHIIFSPNYI